MIFWSNLTDEEADEYMRLQLVVRPWVAWASTRPDKRGPEPTRPYDHELARVELLARKGWGCLTPS